MQKPRKNHGFYSVFLSCIKALKWLQHRISRGQVASFWSPGSSKNAFYLHVYNVFLLARRKSMHFLHGFGALREQPGTQSEPTNVRIAFSLTSWGERVKDERMKGSWGERVPGGRVLGLWGILRRGEYGFPS